MKRIQITVKLYASFTVNRFKTEQREFPDGTVIAEVAHQLGIPAKDLGVTLINGTHAGLRDPVRDGDVVSLMPLVGGG